jgi:putative zinc finger protein
MQSGSDVMECERYRDQMLDVLYGEAEAETARRVEEHQSSCPACRDEFEALGRLRRDLRAWTVPAPNSTRRVVPAAPAYRPFLAMAAGLLLASGAALGLSGSELSYRDGRLAFRLGRAAQAQAADVTALLAEQEARHQREIQDLRRALSGLAVAPAAASAREGAADLATVKRLIRESEVRQTEVLSVGLSDLEARSDEQRRLDLAQVGAKMTYLDGKASLHAARVLLASQQQQR